MKENVSMSGQREQQYEGGNITEIFKEEPKGWVEI